MSREFAILPWLAGGWAVPGAVGAGLAAYGMPLAGIGCAILGIVGAGAGVALRAARLGRPYRALAARFEGMSAGDVDSAIPFLDHPGAAGKIARAASSFCGRARSARESAQRQEAAAAILDRGLSGLSEGDLAFRIREEFPAAYEHLRRHFNEAMGSLSETVSSVSHATQGLHSGASEIRVATQDLSLRTEQQAVSLQQTAHSMNEITDMVKQSADSARRAAQVVGDAHREASEGGLVVDRTVQAMGAIEQSAQEITQIINVIDGIAFQTNLLALNAGVEAARAGDAGKGFAVVANEVRALAQRSAEAAKHIKSLIMTSAQQVEQGVGLVAETGAMLNRIVSRVGEVSSLVAAISESAETQSAGLQQANAAVGEMDKMTQQNAAMVEESTAAVRSLAAQADELARLIGRFRFDGAPVPATAPAPRDAGDGRARASERPRLPAPPAASFAPPPRATGNLAIVVDDDDWSEF